MARWQVKIDRLAGDRIVENWEHGNASQLLEQLGARFASLDYAFGDYDVVAIIEAPDNVSAAAVALAITAGGGVRAYKTTPLLTVQEALEAMRRGKAAQAAYRPPTSAVG